MSDPSRSLPDQPSVRYLKLEARRRLAAGEFDNLHDAQLAIAREHGQSSWTVLKELIESRREPVEHAALRQVGWLISRFGEADEPGWSAPTDGEMREHFTEEFLGRVAMDKAMKALTYRSARLRQQVVVTADEPLQARARVGGMQFEAEAEAEPPHLLRGLRIYTIGSEVTDPRVAAPPTAGSGAVPAAAAETAAAAIGELGLVGVVLAGAARNGSGGGAGGAGGEIGWAVARGRSDLDRNEPMRPGHRFPAYGVTRLVTAVAVLRLVAEGKVGLDDAANDHLRTVRLAGDEVTVRELLSHTGGVDSPANRYADTVPALTSLFGGPVIPCSGARGTFKESSGGYGALGQLIADITGSDFAAAAARLVLDPLGMAGSSFPTGWPHEDPDAVTSYVLEPNGVFVPEIDDVSAIPAYGGMWTDAFDLLRFGTMWHTLLPDALAGEALKPQAAAEAGPGHIGLGWHVNTARGFAIETGFGAGASVSLFVRLSDGHAYAVLTNRQINVAPLNLRVFLQTA
ncbi:MAG TPA: serine hydrolase domain-containing protein [Actinocrinis sp.]|jgi:CubicO group peptidase (beta-lactamase class C family)